MRLENHNMFHSDFKPPNLLVAIGYKEKKELKAIDLGQEDIFNDQKASTCTYEFFNSPFLT